VGDRSATKFHALPSKTKQDTFIDREIELLQECQRHPNVVDCLGYVKTTNRVFIMMPMIATDLGAMVTVRSQCLRFEVLRIMRHECAVRGPRQNVDASFGLPAVRTPCALASMMPSEQVLFLSGCTA